MNDEPINDTQAFPAPMNGPDGCTQYGMTLRDYFAAKALQGQLAAGLRNSHEQWNPALLSQFAYSTADAMLKAREVKP